jgi:hypothetical protein
MPDPTATMGDPFAILSSKMSGADPNNPVMQNLTQGMGKLRPMWDQLKGSKNAPTQPPPVASPYYQPTAPDSRSALLQAMMQRSRAGRGPATAITGPVMGA